LRHGTINQLVQYGRKAQYNDLITQQFGDMPIAQRGWANNYVCFKKEGGTSRPQVNIQLGIGPGISIFNDNLIAFEVVR